MEALSGEAEEELLTYEDDYPLDQQPHVAHSEDQDPIEEVTAEACSSLFLSALPSRGNTSRRT